MKKIKRLTAILLSAILLMSIAPLSVFADSIPDKLFCYYDDGEYSIFNYYSSLKTGTIYLRGLDDDISYFCSFVPGKTGVYSFAGDMNEITADTNDDECFYAECEETFLLDPNDPREDLVFDVDEYEWESIKNYCYLTAGKTYYILLYMNPDYLDIEYVGTVTDVNPIKPLNDLVIDYDVMTDEEDLSLFIDEYFEIKFSNGKSAFIDDLYFENGFYTSNTLTWDHLGFEKVLRYNAIKPGDMVASIEVKGKINLVRYFDNELILEKPVTVVVKFTNGTSKDVKITGYYSDPEIEAPNGRTYSVGLFTDEGDKIGVYAAGFEFGTKYAVKRASFFKNLSRYIVRRMEVRAYYNELLKDNDYSATEKLQIIKDRSEDMASLRKEFIRSIFRFN